jgi:FkbM family methyltransferase
MINPANIFKTIFYHLRICFKENNSMWYNIQLFIIMNKLILKSTSTLHKASKISLFSYNIEYFGAKSIYILIKEIFLFHEYNVNLKKDNPLIIDCGSNIGLSIIYFKKIYPKSKIIAYEASPFVFPILRNNVMNNNLSDVSVFNLALFDKETELPFYFNENESQMASLSKGDAASGNQVLVKTIKLSSVFEEFESIDLVKIDIEGAEIEVIQELALSGYLNKPAQYLIEYHFIENSKSLHLSDFLKAFEINGYKYRIKGDYKNKYKQSCILINFYK